MYDIFCDCDECKARIALPDTFQTDNHDESSKLAGPAVEKTTPPNEKVGTTSQYRPLSIKYTPLDECQDFASWLYFEWNYGYGWEGPYVQLREVGCRIFGVEVTWTKRWKG